MRALIFFCSLLIWADGCADPQPNLPLYFSIHCTQGVFWIYPAWSCIFFVNLLKPREESVKVQDIPHEKARTSQFLEHRTFAENRTKFAAQLKINIQTAPSFPRINNIPCKKFVRHLTEMTYFRYAPGMLLDIFSGFCDDLNDVIITHQT